MVPWVVEVVVIGLPAADNDGGSSHDLKKGDAKGCAAQRPCSPEAAPDEFCSQHAEDYDLQRLDNYHVDGQCQLERSECIVLFAGPVTESLQPILWGWAVL